MPVFIAEVEGSTDRFSVLEATGNSISELISPPTKAVFGLDVPGGDENGKA